MYKQFWMVKMISGLIPVIVLLFVFSSRSYSQINENQNDTITMRTLHNELDTAGDWVKVTKDQIDNGEEGDDDGNYFDSDVNGEYVWVPHYNVIDPEWNPYSNGQWEWCDNGWTWVSGYSWGWLPYHYGRWWYSPIWGWVWSPGYTWAPCWVDWYWGYGYVGWYPISPRHHWRWNHGWAVTNHHTWPREKNYRKWTFVHENDFNKKITKSKLLDPADKKIFADNEKTNTKSFEKGPNVKDLEKITGEKINAKKIVLASDNKKITYDPKTIKSKNVDPNKKVVKSNTDAVKKNPDVRKSKDNTGIKSNNNNNKSNPKSSEKKSVNKTKTSNSNNTKGSYNTRSSNNNNSNSNKGSYNKSSNRSSQNSGNHNSNTRSSNSGSNNRSNNSGNNSSKSSNNGSHRK